MKKIWMIAVVVCAALMVACGGEKKADSVASKAEQFAVQLYEAGLSDDAKKVEAALEALYNYGKDLPEDQQQALLDAHVDALAKKVANERVNGDKYFCDFGAPKLIDKLASIYVEMDERARATKFKDLAKDYYYKAIGLDKK